MTLIGLVGVLVAPSQLAFLWATLLGIGTAGTFSVTLLLMASRARDAVIAARLSGMAQGIGYMISALGPLVAGLLHSISGGWQAPLIMTIAICGAQLVAGLGAARPGVVSR
jgi:CP family cyanate transporter-like MFS transporter